jgi:hypothetical protein
MIQLDTTLRLHKEEDLPFVFDSWYRSQREIYPNKYATDFKATYHKHIANILSNSIIAISCLDDCPDEIISYIVYQSFRNNFILHYAYTKTDARRQHKVSNLIEWSNVMKAPLIFSHAAKSERIMAQLTRRYIFDPSILELLHYES